MNNKALALLTSLLLCSCAVTHEAVKPTAVATAPSVTDADKASTYAALKAELEAMYDTDQKIRQSLNNESDQAARAIIMKKMWATDDANQLRLDEILKQHGWPQKKDVGASAVSTAFLIIHHAPLETMKRHYASVQKAAESGDLSKDSFAMFDDRLRMHEGRPQRYGTQMKGDKNGKNTIWPIEDEANVDKRRAEVGFKPLAEYAKRFNVEYIPHAEREAKAQAATPESKK